MGGGYFKTLTEARQLADYAQLYFGSRGFFFFFFKAFQQLVIKEPLRVIVGRNS